MLTVIRFLCVRNGNGSHLTHISASIISLTQMIRCAETRTDVDLQ